jgi:hypothetical protein
MAATTVSVFLQVDDSEEAICASGTADNTFSGALRGDETLLPQAASPHVAASPAISPANPALRTFTTTPEVRGRRV